MKKLFVFFLAIVFIGIGSQAVAEDDVEILTSTTDGSTGVVVNDGNGVSVFRVTSDGAMGIGTTDPATPLDVNGVITATGGDSDDWNEAHGWGNHAVPGYLTSYTETDPKVGTLTLNYLPKWNGTSLVDTSAYDDNGNIGIGTTAPHEQLEVAGTIRSNTGFNDNGAVGISTTLNFYFEGVYGNVSSLTVSGGIIVGGTLDNGPIPLP